ncbi:MAG: excinuclease ABC subunit UvrC [Clostridiales bacterium]|nr:excinuclease ABC subunit UvrC [Clostridiales bacterium]
MQEEYISKLLTVLPEQPGVYIFKDPNGTVLYVGKANDLKARVKQYFLPSGDSRATVPHLVQKAQSLDYIVTVSQKDALVLENNLIKQYSPKYNIQLKDNKTYPYICVTTSEDFPRVFYTRKLNERDLFFGPYTDVKAVRKTVSALRGVFGFRTCQSFTGPGKNKRACLFKDLGQCPAPCDGSISMSDYRKGIDKIIKLLKGNSSEVKAQLTEEMNGYALNLEFERAARIRDSIKAIDDISQRERVFKDGLADMDIFAMADGVDIAYVVHFTIREGRLINATDYELRKKESDTPHQCIQRVMLEVYSGARDIAKEIIVQYMPEDSEIVCEILSEIALRKVNISVPQKGEKKRVLLMAQRNAAQKLDSKGGDERLDAMQGLKDALRLKNMPKRIEGYDISTFQGTNTVSSMVVFEGGKSKKSDYRHFKIKTVIGTNDFASMHETLTRRLERLVAGDDKFGAKPDLILIDGGKGQLSQAVDVLRAFGVDDIDVISLAKREEEVFIPGQSEPVILPRDSNALKLLQRVRDESHRFAVGYHTLLRDKNSLISVLEDIEGIGPAKRRAIMEHFKTVGDIKNSSIEELCTIKGINRALAEKIMEFFG